jgi:transcription initiation factor TFIIIB Brf1 subunit/transcription initiation factor TFIIB
MNVEDYFKLLENHENKKKKEKVEKVEKVENHEFIIEYENMIEVCVKCGLTKEYIEKEEPIQYLNNKYHLTTIIVGGKNTRQNYTIKKLQKWNNYNYKEVTMTKSFKVIKDICNHFNLNGIIYNNAINYYKNIFLDKNISSRDNIKKSVYVFCIIKSCLNENKDVVLEDILDHIKVKKKHYLKALKKIDKNNIYFIKNIVEDKLKICLDNDLEIDEKDIYKDYNFFIKQDLKINKNSLILFLFYKNLNISNESFITIFNTTKITLKKFNKIIDSVK